MGVCWCVCVEGRKVKGGSSSSLCQKWKCSGSPCFVSEMMFGVAVFCVRNDVRSRRVLCQK